MTLSSRITHHISEFIHDPKAQKTALKYIIAALVIVIALGGAGALYYRYHRGLVQKAQATFSQAFANYQKALQSDNAQEWAQLEELWKVNYQNHRSTLFAPYFLAFQADAALHQGKQEQALRLMDDALINMSKDGLYYVYAIKRALMQIDSGQAKLQTKGVQNLTALAEDKHIPQQDEAIYYLGYTAWTQQQPQKAQQIWSALLKKEPSIWSRKAQALLESH
ncbi:MAG TPA: hypothetical protein VHA52_13225 [Candidatus Babeliaceae bacterium]|nr:hypothetical protein [Candidatus Babeliaceae bacterium]